MGPIAGGNTPGDVRPSSCTSCDALLPSVLRAVMAPPHVPAGFDAPPRSPSAFC
ncbi:MAG: hypothetical protein MZV64_73765 [Ignavibacteriales bacterium]|nr:hypothetical protein [Ignavibacteriales bacterium]